MAEDGLDIGAEEGKSGSKKKLIIIVALLLVLMGGGAAAYFFLLSGPSSGGSSAEAEAAALANEPSIYLDLAPAFTIDFMVEGRQRYVQLNMTVKSKNASQVDAVTLHMPLIRNSLVLLFSSQSFDELQTAEGKVALKTAALDAINGILEQETGQGGIDAVLFTNFVMQ
ncbi:MULTISPECIES: flagellar basal body-associated FliL family protein [Marinomonas]|uniref:Flagellar protein FliL n=1 Tax=Marinomonas arctica TaxID=383750 RepID=A0A7H1J3C5_9GAMM|nr:MULTISPECIES: flagellar basal body-associated FliL family protein [Marinomonas]MCS7485964.1 flagellar protein [Marinomonas sp. BSi20414]QNT04991.1 flagellar basal body-associated FliL family protein [Marinomonas arctica]GGN16968.1 flagellar basal body-associated protein FliL [Marinomonas arctica]